MSGAVNAIRFAISAASTVRFFPFVVRQYLVSSVSNNMHGRRADMQRRMERVW
jgi:hypothetical protein